MKHFHRTQIAPIDVLEHADRFFRALGMERTLNSPRARAFTGPLGTAHVAVSREGGHYTLVVVDTDQTGESRLDRNGKRFFVELHRRHDPRHRLQAAY